jgi:hypothetical protein
MTMTNTPVTRAGRQRSEAPTAQPLIWVSLGLLAISVPLVFNLISRAGNETKTLQEVVRMREEIRLGEIRRDQVKAALNYAGTDAFVDYYARAYLRWAKPGDIVIVPATAPPTRKWWEEFVK